MTHEVVRKKDGHVIRQFRGVDTAEEFRSRLAARFRSRVYVVRPVKSG